MPEILKTYKVLLTRQAQNDLAEIYEYIAADSLENAITFVQAIEEKVFSLTTMPERAAMIPENSVLGSRYRHLPHGRYRIIFRIKDKRVVVLRIIHGARLLQL